VMTAAKTATERIAARLIKAIFVRPGITVERGYARVRLSLRS
jgi:hypothetical protein